MNFQTAAHKVLDLCIELQKQGKFIDPEFDIKLNQITLWFYSQFKDVLPWDSDKGTYYRYIYNQTATGYDVFNGYSKGNFETCLKFLQGLLDPVNEFNEIKTEEK